MNSCKGKSAAKGGILSKLNNLFSTSNPAVKKLMKWKQYDEDDTWAEKAIESLVKKLKNKKGALQELERALTSPGIPTRCVTIPKSRDGRLQVSHKKVLPNVISCRIWRWPDLQINSELEPVSYCQYPYSKKLKEICINPYHYERVESKILPPVLVPRYNYVHGYTSPPYEEPRRYMPHNVVYSENGFSAHKSNSRSTSSGHASSSGCSTSYCGQNSAHSSNSCSTFSGHASSSGCSYCGQNSAHSSNSCSTSSGHASSSGCSTSYCGQNSAHSSNSCSTFSGHASSSGCSYCGQNSAHSSNSCSTSSGHASSSGCSTSYCGQNAAHSSNSCSTSSGHASSSGCSTSYCGQNSAHSSNSCSTSSGQASSSGCSTSYCGQNAAHSSNSCSTSSGHASSSGCSTSYCGQNAAHSSNSCSTSSGHASSSGCSTSYCGQNAAHSSNSRSTSSGHASFSGCSTSYYGQNSAHSSNSCSTSSGQASSSGCSTSYCGQNSAHSSNSCSTSSGHASSSGSSTSYCGQNSYRTYSAQKNFSACRSIYENYTNSDNFPNEQQYLSADLQPVVYQEQQIWCSIAYYEFNFRVGDLFTCPSPSIIVDGFSNPNRNSYRFCLGQLSNVKRTSFVEAVRQRIGEGVLLYYGGGKVHMRNLSNSAIFVQSRNLNQQQNFHVSTVCKIPAGYSSPLEIFNNLAFAEELSKCVHYGFDAVYELRKTCTIRLSFVKGWGKEYQRDDITGIPCWIEVHLHGPLKWLDRVVEQMGGSTVPISSVS